MIRFFSVLVLGLAVATVSLAQNATPDAKVEKESLSTIGPKMVFETETVDYGVIEQGADPYRIFTFSNTGNQPLLITHAKGSCGCTVPTYPKNPIAPGETGEIKVRYDTNRLGKFTKRVTLTTNAGEEQKILTIKGEVVKKPEEPAGVPVREGSLFNNKN